MILREIPDTAVPSLLDVQLARESSRILGEMPLREGGIDIALEGRAAKLPAAALRVLLKALSEISQGHAVAAVSLDEELSTQAAADMLNVSRPFAAKLFDEGAIPSRKVGTHRRARLSDVLAYQQKSDAGRRQALDALTAQAQELGMGY
jgi:excisionase family DNA binding protein